MPDDVQSDAQWSQEALRFFALEVAAYQILDNCLYTNDALVARRAGLERGDLSCLTSLPADLTDKAQEAEKELNQECVRWLDQHTSPNSSGIPAQHLFSEFEAWLRQLDQIQLTIVSSLDAREIAAREWRIPAAVQILKTLDKAKQRVSDPSPLLQRIYSEWIAATLQSLNTAAKAFSEDRRLCILVDTNVLLDLTDAGSKSHDMAQRTLKTIREDIQGGKARLCVTDLTLRELRRVIDAAQDSVLRLELQIALGRPIESIYARGLSSLARQFLLTPEGPSFEQLADRTVSQVLGANGCSPSTVGPIGAEVLAHAKWVTPADVRKHTRGLLDERPYLRRAWAADYHDVALALLCDALNRTRPLDTWVMWSHHKELAEYVDALQLKPHLVSYGPAMCFALQLHGAKIPLSQIRRTCRSLMVTARDDLS